MLLDFLLEKLTLTSILNHQLNYLTRDYKNAKIDNTGHIKQIIETGVFQISILGPIICLIYISYMSQIFTDDSSYT